MNPCSRARGFAAMLVVAVVAIVDAGCTNTGDDRVRPSSSIDRQADVAERGASVMPFDLDRTTHHFTKTDTGGIQTVVADDPAADGQIRLIQQHLNHEADRFRRGEFTDPARIHGGDMPGLAALHDSAGKITIDYAATDDGARITYRTIDPALVAALHAWFDAQVSDHGHHATAD